MQTAQESRSIQEAFLRECGEKIVKAAQSLSECFSYGGKVMIFGNGGSAADAQHMAAELVGKMLVDRRPLPALALTTDSSNLTALGNDFGYETIFAKQIQALARPQDIIIAISTSGNSRNVLAGVKTAKSIGCKVIGLTGGDGGTLKSICDVCLCVSEGTNSSRIQESHIFAIHSIVDLLDRFFLRDSTPEGIQSLC